MQAVPPASLPRSICSEATDPSSLHSHFTSCKSQLARKEVNDVLKRLMSSRKGARGETQCSVYHGAVLPQRFLQKKSDGRWPPAFMILHFTSSLQSHLSPLPKIILIL
uniref:Uncharacterized protein n=1 Tax=Mus musculus TaxID=10090 RepID=Q8CES8_MOUSE|nr:unnamed protein product [Mus musculus]